MIPRECDNDACDYETTTDGSGHPQLTWVHDESCGGPMEAVSISELRARAKAAPSSLLASLLAPEQL